MIIVPFVSPVAAYYTKDCREIEQRLSPHVWRVLAYYTQRMGCIRVLLFDDELRRLASRGIGADRRLRELFALIPEHITLYGSDSQKGRFFAIYSQDAFGFSFEANLAQKARGRPCSSSTG